MYFHSLGGKGSITFFSGWVVTFLFKLIIMQEEYVSFYSKLQHLSKMAETGVAAPPDTCPAT